MHHIKLTKCFQKLLIESNANYPQTRTHIHIHCHIAVTNSSHKCTILSYNSADTTNAPYKSYNIRMFETVAAQECVVEQQQMPFHQENVPLDYQVDLN